MDLPLDGPRGHADRSAAKGDTRTNALKPATLETGVVVQVPLFVEEGDRVKAGHAVRGLHRAREGVGAGRSRDVTSFLLIHEQPSGVTVITSIGPPTAG